MISKGFVVYAVMALAVAPSLRANPISPSDAPANSTMAPITANAGHPSVPPSSSAATGDTSAATAPVGPSSDKPPAINGAAASAAHPPASPPTAPSVGNASSVAINASNVAHPPTPPLNAPGAATPALNRSTAAIPPPATNSSGAHPPTSESNTHDAVPVTPKKAPIAPPQLPAIPSCLNKKKSNGVETHHCEKALDKVVYAANQTLDKFSSFIFANYKTCNINIFKPNNVTLTKAQVSSMVRNITEACHSVGGVLFKTPKLAVKVERGNAENTYEVGNSICQKQECPLTQGDCLSAFYQIPLDKKPKNGTNSFARVTSGNCTVTVSTTDYSNFDISRANVFPTMKKLFNDCGRHPGKIYLPGGSTGLNGDIKISTRPFNHDLCD